MFSVVRAREDNRCKYMHFISLGDQAVSFPNFARVAESFVSEIFQHVTLQRYARKIILRKMQEYYDDRENLKKQNRYFGLVVYMSELYAERMVYHGHAPLPEMIGDAVINVLVNLLKPAS